VIAAAAELATVVVSWRSAAEVARLLREFPVDPRHELLVVDNSGDCPLPPEAAPNVRVLRAGRNLGFAGGSNLGARASTAPRLLFLNPDTEPVGRAFEQVLEGFERWPGVDGVVPRLVDERGWPQTGWQLRELPGPAALLAHAFFWSPGARRREPPAGTPIGQPAAAALALTREVFEQVGGFDERFMPAWFEDVDLARRLRARGRALRYLPEAVFRHRGGVSVDALGYGGFLRAYDRNLAFYLRRHHGRGWELAFRALVPLGALARLALLPLRRPRRARSRREAAGVLVDVAFGAVDNWPEPRSGS